MTETTIRVSLWLACPFNLMAALVFAFPSSTIGQQLGLPDHVHPLYSLLVALFVGLFGFVYAWLARRRAIDQPLLALGSVGKLGAFLIAGFLYLTGVVPGIVAFVALGDLAFAALWLSWLLSGRGQRAA